MNKIYLDPINKTEMLVSGIKKQESQLKNKGIETDTQELIEICRQMEEAGRKQESIENELKAVREDAHKKLEKLKETYTKFKTPIKQNFAPEIWNIFGIPDKK